VSDPAIAGEPSADEPLPAPPAESTAQATIHAETPPPPIPPVEPPAQAAPRGELPAGAGPEIASPAAAVPRAYGRGNRRGRSLMARVGAVIALVVVAGAVWLLARSLLDTGHSMTVAAPVAVKVLVPEGKTRLQIAQIARAGGLTGSYRQASRHSRLLDPAHYGAPAGTPDLEGFLFPATYDMDPHANVQRLVDEQLVTFRERFGAREFRRAHALGVTPYDLLTVASMIEREAQVPHDRALIAAVIYNRLHEGMPLGIDATIYYAVELQKGIPTYTSELSEAELHIDSPYNTRTHAGLPPTPISNPGQASIEAAAHPAHVSYLYYVAAADGCGEQTFSTSEAAFEQNVAAYKAAVQRNGGKPPTCKGR
jgi:cell division protein YceG involved in septum cleavage